MNNAGQQALGDIAPRLAEITDQLLFGDIWRRPGRAPRERSLITVSALLALNRLEQLPFHLRLARANGVSRAELGELLTHLAFYTGWPCVASAANLLRSIYQEEEASCQ
ncbi:carboxymuconolactone decarboxylase family protein [Massilia sp. NR 4-1]|uniref:carboxymuconolactone decarboxylase family protein n=1 Tax=Massilia sp. NR 4-1 TaxID=1678028 RepID=UPI00067BF3C9|nr:carboxymuconolactone decarboxylase family protein [Massilia sp. NR 4-1]AKU23652.1 4-carboxymuconolactone decarboxylase [Massilia sp. NR 4-1]